jgi:hypothetical protein
MAKASPREEPALADVLEALRRREPIFHQPAFGTTRADFERMTDFSFCEVGASGRRYDRDFVLDTLERRQREGHIEAAMEVTDFDGRRLADDVYLVTYTLRQGQRLTRRATIWRRDADAWKILYHQGTVVDGA